MNYSTKLATAFALAGTFLTANSAVAQSGDNCANAIPLTVNNNNCSFTAVSNNGLSNSGQTPIGSACDAFAGGDLWLSVVMPPSGELTLTTQSIPLTTPPAMDINMAIWSGPCAGLLLVTCDDDSGIGFFAEATFTGVPGQTYYVQLWETNNNVQGTFNVCANGTPNCTSPAATFTRQCAGSSQYQVTVNVTSLGDASFVNIVNDGGAPAFNGLSSTGSQVVGPFDLGIDVTLTVQHGNDADCNINRFITAAGLGCERILDCASDLNETYCYRNNDNAVFLYSSPDGSPVTISFDSGLIEDGIDQITIRNGDNASAPILFSGSNGGNLSGLTHTATSGSLYLSVGSDAAASCQDNSFGLGGGWEWTVQCDGCDAPQAAFTVVENCADALFSVEVDITSLGNASSVTINNDGGAAAVTAVAGTGLQLVGPFAAGTPVEIIVSNDDIANCQITSTALNSDCPSFDACENGTTISSQTTFAASEISSNLLNAPAGSGQCEGVGNRPEVWFNFNAAGSVAYIRVEATGDFDPAIEVFDACGGNQLACTNEAGPGTRELFWLTDLNPGATYVYRVYHAGSGSPSSTNFATAVAHIPTVQLRNDFCDVTDLSTSSIIRSTTPNPDFLLEAFIWEFTELEAPFQTYEITSPNGANPQFRMFWFPELQFGRSYSVRVRALMFQGPNLGDYGPACTIAMAGAPQTALRPDFEDGSFNACDILRAVPAPGADNFRWTFDDGETTLTYQSNSSNPTCRLRDVEGIQLGTLYTVEVFATIAGVEGTESTPRNILMNNFVPSTQLNADLVECGATYALSDVITAVEICAQSYTFRFENLSQSGLEAIEHVRPNRVLKLSFVSGLIPGDTYSVTVRAAAGGLEGEYGEACTIELQAPQLMLAHESAGPGLQSGMDAEAIADMLLYPNPVHGHEVMLTINGLTDEEQAIDIEVYNLAGQRLYVERFANHGRNLSRPLRLPSGLAQGTYLIRAFANGEVVNTQRLMMR